MSCPKPPLVHVSTLCSRSVARVIAPEASARVNAARRSLFDFIFAQATTVDGRIDGAEDCLHLELFVPPPPASAPVTPSASNPSSSAYAAAARRLQQTGGGVTGAAERDSSGTDPFSPAPAPAPAPEPSSEPPGPGPAPAPEAPPAPQPDAPLLPVMVYIHGGSFVVGSADSRVRGAVPTSTHLGGCPVTRAPIPTPDAPFNSIQYPIIHRSR